MIKLTSNSVIKQGLETYRDEGLIQLTREGVLFTTKNMVTDSTFPVTMPIYVTVRKQIQRLAIKRALEMGFENRLRDIDLREFKSSDTVFILGSGSTINEISESKWEHIEDHDSFGLNFWLIHDHVPTVYVFELPVNTEQPGFQESYYNLLQYKGDTYSETPIIVKDVPRTIGHLDTARYPKTLISNTYLAEEIRIPWRRTDYRVFNRSIDWFNENGYFESDGRMNPGLKKRASVSFLIHMAVKMGYEKIVLCGVDMNDSKYFYNENREELQDEGVPLPPVLDVNETNSHRTNDPSVYRPIFENVLYALNENLLKPRGISLYTESTTSATYPELPLYEEAD